MPDLTLAQEVLKRVEEIEKQVDNISATSNAQIQLLNCCFGEDFQNKYYYYLDSEIQDEQDFYNAIYILIGLLSLNKSYSEQINFQTKEICEILEGQLDKNIINNIYNNIAGDFFIEDPEYQVSLNSSTTLFCNTSAERFKEIFKSKYYEPNGTKYLQTLLNFLDDYRKAITTIPEYLETLRNAFT